ncbi:MAG TPA: DNA polymerase III subunit delta [Patescibacteria group bacterium]|nr:DNA polymerase III subunit delta [Patescibacteria group bacterium]
MITTLTGSNYFRTNEKLHELVSDFIRQYGDLALEKVDGEEAEFDKIRESLQSLPFLATRKLVVLRSPGAQKQFLDQFENLLAEIPETTDVILVEPKLDKRSVYYKFLKRKTDFHELTELDEYGLSTWLVQKAKNDGGKLNLTDAKYLIDRVGTNQQLLNSELEKLLTFDLEISRKNIDALTESVPQSTVFQLLDAALNNRAKQAMELYAEQRAQKVEPFAILAMLVWQLHILAIIKTAGSRSDAEIASEAKINPYVVRKSRLIAGKLTEPELKNLIKSLSALDIKLKTENIDADEALMNLFLQISSK